MAQEFSILAKLKLNTKDIQNQLNALQNKTISIGADTKDFDMSISVANAVLNQFLDTAGAMVEQVYELDKSLTEFKKVSDLRGSGLEKYTEQLSEAAEITARTTSQMVDAATMFRKSGFTDQDAAQLATIATMYQNIADTEVSASQAAASIVSQIQAFGRGAIEPIHIIDAYNEV